MDKTYKQYMLNCSIYKDIGTDSEDLEAWKNEKFFFDTEQEMVKFVKEQLFIRVESAFKLEKLDNNIFAQ